MKSFVFVLLLLAAVESGTSMQQDEFDIALQTKCWGARPFCSPISSPVCVCDRHEKNCNWVCVSK